MTSIKAKIRKGKRKSRTQILKLMDETPPMMMSEEEILEFEENLKIQKEREFAVAEEQARKLAEMWN
jgi:hypothetical protein